MLDFKTCHGEQWDCSGSHTRINLWYKQKTFSLLASLEFLCFYPFKILNVVAIGKVVIICWRLTINKSSNIVIE